LALFEVLMSRRRKVPNAETAQTWLAAAERSGLTRAQWCAEAGVDARSLQCWRIALARRAVRPGVHFVELVPTPDRGSAPPPVSLRVQVSDVVIEVPSGFDAASLAEVLRVVRAC
jgi:hypothetical protein